MFEIKNEKIAIPVVLFAGLLWSFGPLIVRYMDQPNQVPWQYLFTRGIVIFLLLNIYLFFEEGKDFYKNYLKAGVSGLIGGCGLALAMITFIYSIINTSAAITLLCLALGLNSYRASRRRPLVISQESLYILMLVAISIGFQEVSLAATFWCYPLPLYFLFTVRKQLSNLVAGTWLLFVTIQCFARLDIAIAIRVSLTLALVMLMGRTYVSMID